MPDPKEQLPARWRAAFNEPADLSPPERLGRFRIERRLGAGGMGIVYAAFEEGLDRVVALKLWPRTKEVSALESADLLREARLAAQLAHAHIVPVHAAGATPEFFWLAMRWIDGVDLSRLIRDLRQLQRIGSRAIVPRASRAYAERIGLRGKGPEVEFPWRAHWREVARIGSEVADALAAAHAQGVLHRDVKPSNLLIDAQGSAWVTDFGIAQLAGEEGGALQWRGTLGYALPEGNAGAPSSAGDLYALGLSLAELGALGRTESGAAQIAPSCPRALREILERATALEQGARWADAAALARDLRDWLQGRPTEAERRSPLRRAQRAIQSHRRDAAFVLIAIASLIGAAGVGWQRSIDTASALQETELARDVAEDRSVALREAHARAEDNLRAALAAFAEIYQGLSDEDPLGDPDLDPMTVRGLQPKDLAIVRALLQAHQTLAAANPESEELRRATAVSLRRTGDAYRWTGDLRAARRAYARAAELLKPEAEGEPTDAATIAQRAALLASLGTVAREAGEMWEARAHFEEAYQLLRQKADGNRTKEQRYREARLLASIAEGIEFDVFAALPTVARRRQAALSGRFREEALQMLDDPLGEPEPRWRLLRARIAILGARSQGRAQGPDEAARAALLAGSDELSRLVGFDESPRLIEVRCMEALAGAELLVEEAEREKGLALALRLSEELTRRAPQSLPFRLLQLEVLAVATDRSPEALLRMPDAKALFARRFQLSQALYAEGARDLAIAPLTQAAIAWAERSRTEEGERAAARGALVLAAEALVEACAQGNPSRARVLSVPRMIRLLRQFGEAELAHSVQSALRRSPLHRGPLGPPSGETALPPGPPRAGTPRLRPP